MDDSFSLGHLLRRYPLQLHANEEYVRLLRSYANEVLSCLFISSVLYSGRSVGRSVASRTQTERRDAAGAGDLAAAGGPRHHRRHRPLHHLPLIPDLASSQTTTHDALRRRRRLLIRRT